MKSVYKIIEHIDVCALSLFDGCLAIRMHGWIKRRIATVCRELADRCIYVNFPEIIVIDISFFSSVLSVFSFVLCIVHCKYPETWNRSCNNSKVYKLTIN